MRKMTEMDLFEIVFERRFDVELKKRGFKHGLDYDEDETFTDDCEQEIEEIGEVLTYQYPSLEKEIRDFSYKIRCEIREVIDNEEWE